jgi:hypothetical protein
MGPHQSIISMTTFVVALISFSCDSTIRGNGHRISSTIEVPDFNYIEISGNYEVELVRDSQSKLIIEADENLLEFIETKASGGKLHIRNSKTLISRQNIKISVHYEHLNKLSSAGSSVIYCANMIKADQLELIFPGTGSMNLEIETDKLKASLSGAGLIKLVGYAHFQDIEINGTGSLNAMNLLSHEAKIRLNGIGNAEIDVREKLDAEINGLGSIKYKGKPANLRQEIRGMGKIKAIEGHGE